jgi:hypothetical protein
LVAFKNEDCLPRVIRYFGGLLLRKHGRQPGTDKAYLKKHESHAMRSNGKIRFLARQQCDFDEMQDFAYVLQTTLLPPRRKILRLYDTKLSEGNLQHHAHLQLVG